MTKNHTDNNLPDCDFLPVDFSRSSAGIKHNSWALVGLCFYQIFAMKMGH